MKRADYLKEQAALLRGIAQTFDDRDLSEIRERLLVLADECEELERRTMTAIAARGPGER